MIRKISCQVKNSESQWKESEFFEKINKINKPLYLQERKKGINKINNEEKNKIHYQRYKFKTRNTYVMKFDKSRWNTQSSQKH